jgi:hypothetical protein
MSVYWQQWTREELLSLHGTEILEASPLDYDTEKEDEPTLTPYDIDGLTWRDFF